MDKWLSLQSWLDYIDGWGWLFVSLAFLGGWRQDGPFGGMMAALVMYFLWPLIEYAFLFGWITHEAATSLMFGTGRHH